jgi:hypothetical protein
VTVHRQAPIGLAAGPHAPLQASLAIGSSQGREPLYNPNTNPKPNPNPNPNLSL